MENKFIMRYILLILVFQSALTGYSQSFVAGIKAGASYSPFHHKFQNATNHDQFNYYGRVNHLFGFELDYFFAKQYGLKVGLENGKTGYKVETDNYTNDLATPYVEWMQSFSYWRIPVSLVYRQELWKLPLKISAGISLDYISNGFGSHRKINDVNVNSPDASYSKVTPGLSAKIEAEPFKDITFQIFFDYNFATSPSQKYEAEYNLNSKFYEMETAVQSEFGRAGISVKYNLFKRYTQRDLRQAKINNVELKDHKLPPYNRYKHVIGISYSGQRVYGDFNSAIAGRYYFNLKELPDYGYSIQLDYTKMFNEQVGIKTGIGISRPVFAFKFIQRWEDIENSQHVSQMSEEEKERLKKMYPVDVKYRNIAYFLDLPVNLRFHLLKKKNLDIFFSSGFKINYLVKHIEDAYYEGATNPASRVVNHSFRSKDEFFSIGGNAGFDIEYMLSEKLFAIISPEINKYNLFNFKRLTGAPFGSESPYSYGIRAGVKLKIQ